MSERKFYKRIVTVEVLSEDPISMETGIKELAHEIVDGDWSGRMVWGEQTEIDGPTVAKLLVEQGSDPEFFDLDDEGNNLREDED